MRVLAVCDRPPSAAGPHADGSTLITAQVLTRLAGRVELDLAYFRDGEARPDVSVTASSRRVTPLPLEPSRTVRRLTEVASVSPRSGPRARATVARLARDADVVYLHGLGVFDLAAVVDAPVVVQEVDPHSLFWRDRVRDRTSVGSTALALARYHRIRRVERAASRLATEFLLVSPSDASELGHLLGRPVRGLPNGVPAADPALVTRAGVPGRIVFLGGLDYRPNVDSAIVLCRDILPRVQSVVPGAHVVLVGRRPVPSVRALARRPGVRLAEDVPDVDVELALARVAAFPGGYGRGVRNSVLQSLQIGRPVVASTASARSVPAGAHLLVHDDVTGAAAALAQVLLDDELHGRAAASARSAARTLPTWDGTADTYLSVLDGAARSASTGLTA